jgi:hypothetical protein
LGLLVFWVGGDLLVETEEEVGLWVEELVLEEVAGGEVVDVLIYIMEIVLGILMRRPR